MSTKIQHQDMTFVQRLLSDVRQLIKMPYRPADIDGDEEAELLPKVYIMIDSSIMAPSSEKEYVLSQSALNYLVRRLVIGARQAGADVVIKRADTNVDDVQMAGTMIRIPPRKMALNAKAVDSFVEEMKDKEVVACVILITDGSFRNIQSLMWTGEPYMHRRLFIIGTPELEKDADEIGQLWKKTGMQKPKDGKQSEGPNFKSHPVYVLKPKEMEQLDQNAEATKNVSDEELAGTAPRMAEPAAVTEGIQRRRQERLMAEEFNASKAGQDTRRTTQQEVRELLPSGLANELREKNITVEKIDDPEASSVPFILFYRNMTGQDVRTKLGESRSIIKAIVDAIQTNDDGAYKTKMGLMMQREPDILIFPVADDKTKLKRLIDQYIGAWINQEGGRAIQKIGIAARKV